MLKLILNLKHHIPTTSLRSLPKLIFMITHKGWSSTNTQLEKSHSQVLKQRSHFSLAQSQNAKHQIRMSNTQQRPAALNMNYLSAGCAQSQTYKTIPSPSPIISDFTSCIYSIHFLTSQTSQKMLVCFFPSIFSKGFGLIIEGPAIRTRTSPVVSITTQPSPCFLIFSGDAR